MSNSKAIGQLGQAQSLEQHDPELQIQALDNKTSASVA
jgi:hypothetical protein